MEDEDPDSDDLFFTSTLLIIHPANGSELVCSGTAAGGTVFQRSVIVLSSVSVRSHLTSKRLAVLYFP